MIVRLFALLGLAALTWVNPVVADPFEEPDPYDTQPAAKTNNGLGFLGDVSGGIGGAWATPTPTPKPHADIWQELEDVSGTDAVKKYRESDEYKMQRELQRPLPKRSSVGATIDDLEEAIKNLEGKDSEDPLKKFDK